MSLRSTRQEAGRLPIGSYVAIGWSGIVSVLDRPRPSRSDIHSQTPQVEIEIEPGKWMAPTVPPLSALSPTPSPADLGFHSERIQRDLTYNHAIMQSGNHGYDVDDLYKYRSSYLGISVIFLSSPTRFNQSSAPLRNDYPSIYPQSYRNPRS